jgi:hypothetical protein
VTVSYQVVYWRDIPAQVKVRAGRERRARALGDRFQRAVDQVAMRTGVTKSDDYLEEWRSLEWQEREGELEAVLESVVGELESLYPEARLKALLSSGGRED